MPRFIALLRPVNVGGMGKLAMTELAAMGLRRGFAGVGTYIARGKLVFDAGNDEPVIRMALAT